MTSVEPSQKTVYWREKYQSFGFDVSDFNLDFTLVGDRAVLKASYTLSRAETSDEPETKCVLHCGCFNAIQSISVMGQAVPLDQLERQEETLVIDVSHEHTQVAFTLELDPAKNTALEGLYKSGPNLYTQCEAEGFRRIVPFPDRPDVLTTYTVSITAEKASFPVLLSNGNLVSQTDHADGTHTVVWHDPFPKPSYLFALVAGTFDHVEDHFTTASGRDVAIHFWTDPGEGDKVDHAIQSLKDAMVWDEKVYGLEYDLDVFNVVAVGDFNMGAMENKSLNIFNTSCVLARGDTATDRDFANVQAVVAHEYFHNWTGNRITCRDWFQLSLKEGLTVFRDQEFSADMNTRAVNRIDDVRTLRSLQFPEDAGPMAHPIRPDSYIEINNFYTMTVYEKGAEVIRMIHTLLGAEGFRKGMDVYVARHDGEAATCEDFVLAMEAGSGQDLSQFRLWYSQAGTPKLRTNGRYDPAGQCYTLDVQQILPKTPDGAAKKPQHIPFAVGLVGQSGQPVQFSLSDTNQGAAETHILHVTDDDQSFTLNGVTEPPVVSLLRGFSAPVRLESHLSEAEKLHLMTYDTDTFVRWDTAQEVTRTQMLAAMPAAHESSSSPLSAPLVDAMRATLLSPSLDDAFKALFLVLPSENDLAEAMRIVDPVGVHMVREAARRQLADELADIWPTVLADTRSDGPYVFEPQAVARRNLNSVALAYMSKATSLQDQAFAAARDQVRTADNMTDQLSALTTLLHANAPDSPDILVEFYDQWQHNALVMDRWLSLQASQPSPSAAARVQGLLSHAAFSWTNPNKIRAVLGAFSRGNPFGFHVESGEGYRVLSDAIIKLDDTNPQIAARLASGLTAWRRYDEHRQARMVSELERIAKKPNLSSNTYEVVTKTLA